LQTVAKVVHSPVKAILPANLRNSKGWAKFGRPVVKVGTAVVIGAVTGGVSIAGGSVVFTGLSTAGAVTAGAVSAATGGLSSKAFQPLHDLALPAAAGLVGGNAWRSRAAIKSYAQKLFNAELNRAKTNFLDPKALGGQAAGLLNNLNKPKPRQITSNTPLPAFQKNQAALAQINRVTKKNKQDGVMTAVLVGGGGGAIVAGPIGALVGASVGYYTGSKA